VACRREKTILTGLSGEEPEVKDDLKGLGRNERKLLQQVVWESGDWLDLAEGKDKRQAVVHTV
jgi:hypothetical protein